MAKRQVFHVASSQGKGKDFGWEHGKMINGNRYHWKCKWCNFVGRSGGVTRLKKHLAGGWHVASCAKVPRHISDTMNIHLLELRKKRLFNRKRVRDQVDIDETKSEYPPLDISIDEDNGHVGLSMQGTNGTEQSGRADKSFKNNIKSRDSYPGSNFAIQQLNTDTAKVIDLSVNPMTTARPSNASYRRSRTALRRSTTYMAQAVKEPPDIVLYTEQSDLAGPECHWRSVLQHMLQLPDICGGGGIEISISDALTYGPSGDARASKRVNIPMNTAEPKDTHKSHFQMPEHSRNASANTLVDALETGTCEQTDAIANRRKCQEVLVDILCSGKFISLCNLLCENFQGIKVDKLFDISQINNRMKNGVYGQSPDLLHQDLQQIWRRFQKIGEEIVLLATGFSDTSHDIHQKQVGEDVMQEACQLKREENGQVDIVAKISNDSDTATQFPSCGSVPSTKPDQSKVCGLYKVCTCKQCGSEADGERSLICDGCEAVYHFSCVEPAVQQIPSRSWYCASCSKERTESSEPPERTHSSGPPAKSTREDDLHDNCAVCERLEFSETKENGNESGETAMANGSRESSVSSMESEEPPEPSRTALARLCKQCGTCEDDDKRFLMCGHSQCPYKYYHIRCLTTSQIASPQQVGQRCWYCPSCLCRACFRDKDDDMIVLCDNCDEAYHIYCMKPPRSSIPKGQWFCLKCNVAKAKEGMRRYEQWILQQHGKKEVRQSNEGNRSMDVLLSAVEKLSSEEKLAAGRIIEE